MKKILEKVIIGVSVLSVFSYANIKDLEVEIVKESSITIVEEKLEIKLENPKNFLNKEVLSLIENPSNVKEYQTLPIILNGVSLEKQERKREVNFNLQKISIMNDPISIKYIENPSEELQLMAIELNYNVYKYINNPTKEVSALFAVSKNPYNIQYISNPSERVQLAAVKQKGDSIQFIKEPTNDVQLESLKSDISNCNYIENLTTNSLLHIAIEIIENHKSKVFVYFIYGIFPLFIMGGLIYLIAYLIALYGQRNK